MTSPTQTSSGQPPPPPRPLTASAQRRSWFEPGVRSLWLVGLVVLAVSIALAGVQLIESMHDRALISRNYSGWALITEAGGYTRKNYAPDPASLFKLEIHLPDRPPYELSHPTHLPQGTTTYATTRPSAATTRGAIVQESPGPILAVGRYLKVFINPQDPNDFTARQSVSLASELIIGLLFVPVAVVLFVAAIVSRRGILRTWKEGDVAVAVAVESRHSAIAPLSRIVRFTLRDSGDRRIFSATVPTRFASFEPGDEFYIIHPARKPQRAIVAGLYQP